MGGLFCAKVLSDGEQELLAMVAQLVVAHHGIGRQERSRECTELTDDFAVMCVNEGAERLRLSRGHV